MTVEHNISRLQYLLNLYKISVAEFLKLINQDRKRLIKHEEVFSNQISVDHLKRIDKIFNKGLSFYLDPKDPPDTKQASIFFRKKDFNSEPNLQAKKIINEFEELKLSISAMAKLSNINVDRKLPVYTIMDDPKSVAKRLRGILYPYFYKDQKDFLEALINKLGDQNIFVFEFVETHNQKERANIDGVFLLPNVIVIKRQEGYSFRREIFTLIHELAHYLLNIEEVEKVEYESLSNLNLSDIESWCNDFAFNFLIGEYEARFNNLPFADSDNDYNHEEVEEISANTHLSELALFTRLRFADKISYPSYITIKNSIEARVKAYYEELKRKRDETAEDDNKQGGGLKIPIKSNLLISTVQAAFYEGVVDEFEAGKMLRVSPEKIDNYIP